MVCTALSRHFSLKIMPWKWTVFEKHLGAEVLLLNRLHRNLPRLLPRSLPGWGGFMSSSIWDSSCSHSCSSDSPLLSASCYYFFFFNPYLILNASKKIFLCAYLCFLKLVISKFPHSCKWRLNSKSGWLKTNIGIDNLAFFQECFKRGSNHIFKYWSKFRLWQPLWLWFALQSYRMLQIPTELSRTWVHSFGLHSPWEIRPTGLQCSVQNVTVKKVKTKAMSNICSTH